MEPRFDEPMNAPVPPRRDASKLRAADADRQQVAEQLRSAVDEGRLTLDEYDERLTAVYAAKTYGDLSRLTADLPAPASGQPVPGPRTPSSETHGTRREPTAHRAAYHAWRPYGGFAPWRPWFAVSIVTVVIWVLTGLGGNGFSYFWPMWVIVPWGLVLALQTLGRGSPRGYGGRGGYRHGGGKRW